MKRKLLQLDLTSTEFDSRSNWLRFDSKRKGIFVKWGHVNPWKSAVNLSLIWQEEDFLRLQWGLPSGMRTHPPNSSSTFYWLLFHASGFFLAPHAMELQGKHIRPICLPTPHLHCKGVQSAVCSLHHIARELCIVGETHPLLTPLPCKSFLPCITLPGNHIVRETHIAQFFFWLLFPASGFFLASHATEWTSHLISL